MHDLVTLGEVLLRLAIPSPARFETARALDVQIGGAEANVAAACARLGLRTAWISALPDNPWGERVRRELVGHGIDCAYVRMLPGTRLGLYFLEYGVAPRPVHVLYDRRDSAFSRLTPEAVDWAPIQRARLVHVSGITPALGVHARTLVERIFDQVAVVSFDINYRSALWTPAEARVFAESVLPRARYVFLGRTEAQTVFGLDGRAEDVLDALARRAPKATIALLQGGDGSTAFDGRRFWRPRGRHPRHRPAHHRGRRRYWQDDRHYPAHCPPHRAGQGSARGDPRPYLHRQGRRRDGGAGRRAGALRLRRRRDRHLPRVR